MRYDKLIVVKDAILQEILIKLEFLFLVRNLMHIYVYIFIKKSEKIISVLLRRIRESNMKLFF